MTVDSTTSFPHPDNFSPLFTLVEDEVTGEQHHPHVHYIFSDDHTDGLTDAVLQTLTERANNAYDDVRASQTRSSNRYIIVDLDASGQHVLQAQSLSSRWQVAETQLTRAPTFGEGEGETAGEAGMMLKIRGSQGHAEQYDDEQVPSVVLGRAQDAADGSLREAMSALAERFEKEMSVLKRLMDEDSGLP